MTIINFHYLWLVHRIIIGTFLKFHNNLLLLLGISMLYYVWPEHKQMIK